MRILDAGVQYQGFWGSFADLIWWFLMLFILIAYVFTLFSIVTDLFRDHTLGGGWKALWIFFLIFFPIITALVYLVARGKGMGERSLAHARQYRTAQDDDITHVAGVSPSDEIGKAKQLLDAGTITPEEYQTIKVKALS